MSEVAAVSKNGSSKMSEAVKTHVMLISRQLMGVLSTKCQVLVLVTQHRFDQFATKTYSTYPKCAQQFQSVWYHDFVSSLIFGVLCFENLHCRLLTAFFFTAVFQPACLLSSDCFVNDSYYCFTEKLDRQFSMIFMKMARRNLFP